MDVRNLIARAGDTLMQQWSARPRVVLACGAGGAVVLLLLIGVLLGRMSAPAAARLSMFGHEDTDGAERTHVTALGRIEPASEVIDLSGPAGTRVMAMLVREGQRVEVGTELARLDGYGTALAATERATVLLKEARELHAAETLDGEAAIEEADLRLRQAKTLMPLETRAQEAVVKRLQADLDNARRSLDRLNVLNADKRVTDQQVDDQHATVLRFEEELAQAGFDLARQRGTQEIEQLLAGQRQRRADAALERAQVGTRIESLAADLALARAELEQQIIRAPVAGVVLKILTWPGERIDDLPVLKLGDTSQMYAVAEIYETDARFVRPGLGATVVSPALAQPVIGKVERLSPLIFKNDVLDVDPASRVDARVMEVRIRLDDSRSVAHLSNLQVYVDIDLSSPAGGKSRAAGK